MFDASTENDVTTRQQLILGSLGYIERIRQVVAAEPSLRALDPAQILLVTIPISLWLTRAIGKRSQRHFVAQWRHTGALNGQIEETFTGHELVRVFGRRTAIEAWLRAKKATEQFKPILEKSEQS